MNDQQGGVQRASEPASQARDPSIHLVPPEKGSGPAVVVLGGDGAHDGSTRTLCATLAEEGYLAAAPLGPGAPDVAALVAHARGHGTHTGKAGLVAFGAAAEAAWQAARRGLVDCAVLYGDPALVAAAAAADPPPVPVTIHLAGTSDAAASATLKIYEYPEVRAGFARPENAAHDPHAEGLAWSRTVRALKRTMGPHYDLEELWDFHLACEFRDKDAEAAMRTMVPEPYVNHIPTLTGGVGYEMLKRFYKYHFVNQVPRDRRTIPISQTVGADRIVDEKVFCFTHDCAIDWLLPGVAPTGRYVEIPLVGIVTFRGDKLVNEHIYWDQASVLVQVGLLDPAGLPVAGREQARKLMDRTLPSNEMLPGWDHTTTLPLHD